MKNIEITDDIIDEFIVYLKENERSNMTIQKYIRDIRCFETFLQNRNIKKNIVMEYKSFLKDRYALASANSMIAALNSFLKFTGRNDLCVKQFRIQKNVYCAEERELTKNEYLLLVNTAERLKKTRLSLLIQTICSTGIRISELEFITVEAVRAGEAIVSCKGKTRTVFIVSALRKKLIKYAQIRGISQGKIFITKNGNALNRSNIWQEMKSLCKYAGVNPDKVFPHNLRHLFARTFYCLEKDIAKLADILGHSSINTTRIYMISSGAEHRRKVERMHLII